MKNPYPEKIVDEVTGIEVPNDAHRIWQEGYETACRDILKAIVEIIGDYLFLTGIPERAIESWKKGLNLFAK